MSFKVRDAIEFGGGLSLSRGLRTAAKGLKLTGGRLEIVEGGLTVTAGGLAVTGDYTITGDTTLTGALTVTGLLTCDTTALFTGIPTFTAAPVFNAGIGVADGASTMIDNAAATTAPLTLTNATAVQTAFHAFALVGADADLGADNDEVYMTFAMRDEEAGPTAAAEIARISAMYINAEAADDGAILTFDTFLANTLTEVLRVGQNAAADATSQLLTLQGTTLLPCYAEIGDPNTGMNLDGSDGIELITGGAAELTLTTTGGTFAGTLAVTNRLTASETLTAGSGLAGIEVFDTGIFAHGNVIVTRMFVDLTGLVADNADLDIIGDDDAANCNFGQITTAITGDIIGGQMTCLEVPAGAGTIDDIDLYTANVATGTEGVASGVASLAGNAALVTSGAAWTAGRSVVLTAMPPANDYLYLAAGHAAGDSSAFTAGKFLIELYGT